MQAAESLLKLTIHRAKPFNTRTPELMLVHLAIFDAERGTLGDLTLPELCQNLQGTRMLGIHVRPAVAENIEIYMVNKKFYVDAEEPYPNCHTGQFEVEDVNMVDIL